MQRSVFQIGDSIGLVFTKVVDQLNLGLIDEDEETHEVTDRSYWAEPNNFDIPARKDVLSVRAQARAYCERIDSVRHERAAIQCHHRR